MVLANETATEVQSRRDAIEKALTGIPEFGDEFTSSAIEGDEALKDPVQDVGQRDGEDDGSDDTKTSKTTDHSLATQDQPDPEAAKAAATFEAPKTWSEGRRNEFAQLPANAQKLLLDVHKEANAGFTKYAQETSSQRKIAESVSKVFEPYREELRKANMDEASAIQFLTKEREQFNRDPIGFIAPIATRLGNGDPAPFIRLLIDKTGLTQEQLFGAPAQTTGDPATSVDPRISQLEQKLTQSQQKLYQFEQTFQTELQKREQELRERRQREEDSVQSEVSRIIASQDESGNPKYPYYEQVEQTMVNLIAIDPQIAELHPSKLVERFDLAYRKAVRMHDDLYQRETEAEVAKRLEKMKTQKAVQKASAATTRKGGLGSQGDSTVTANMSSKEAVRKAMADMKL